MSKNDGGAAFPQTVIVQQDDGFAHSMSTADGMSLRDYFAAKIICGLSANSGINGFDFEGLARMSYVQADAMLAERAK
jgi:hypothetical protein